jgi:hypothetical protein
MELFACQSMARKTKPKTRLQNLQIELAKVRKQHAKLHGEVTKEALQAVIEIDHLMTELGTRLKFLRLSVSLSQEKVSTALGRKSNVMYRAEKFPQNLKLERYAKLLAIYGKASAAFKMIGATPVKSVAASSAAAR